MSQILAFYCDQQSYRGSAMFSTPQYLQLSASTDPAGSHRQVEKHYENTSKMSAVITVLCYRKGPQEKHFRAAEKLLYTWLWRGSHQHQSHTGCHKSSLGDYGNPA